VVGDDGDDATGGDLCVDVRLLRVHGGRRRVPGEQRRRWRRVAPAGRAGERGCAGVVGGVLRRAGEGKDAPAGEDRPHHGLHVDEGLPPPTTTPTPTPTPPPPPPPPTPPPPPPPSRAPRRRAVWAIAPATSRDYVRRVRMLGCAGFSETVNLFVTTYGAGKQRP
jgi:hypothetical protein